MKNLHELLVSLAKDKPKKAALVVCTATGIITEEISRATLLAKVDEAAAHLHALGLRVGDKIALDYSNSPELLIISWAAWSCGIVTVPLDTKRDTEELRAYKLRIGDVKTTFKEKIPGALSTNVVPVWMPDFSHEALILFTSGTTASPKGAQMTLENLVINAKGIAEWLHLADNDRFLVELPLHHINSTTFCLASLIAGASIAIPPLYSNSRFFEQAARSGATITSVVPSIIFDQLSREKEFLGVRSILKLNRIQLGSAPVVTEDALEFMRKFSIPLYQGYGQTETALRVTGVPMNLSPHVYDKLIVDNSIGTPMQWAVVEVADADGNILGENQEGELIVKGPAVMKGYVGGEPAFRNGYFLTGDIGYWRNMEEGRFFFLKGRSKEIIIKGGINISPIAVENALKKISSDIDQAYVVGVPDKRYGEEVGVAVVWKENIDEQRATHRLKLALLAGNNLLSAYEMPRYMRHIRKEELPMTSTGKVQRTVLRKNIVGTFEPIYNLLASAEFNFVIITSQSPLFERSYALYNHCWQPLIKTKTEYKKYLDTYLTLGAINKNDVLSGQISFSYKDNILSCVSICSATFKPKPVPQIAEIPNMEFVRQYLLAGHDPVMNFHRKLGAELVTVTPNGRPDDASSLGYTMLLHYPRVKNTLLSGPVSSQLTQAVGILASDADADMYAVSRPGGLASFLERGV